MIKALFTLCLVLIGFNLNSQIAPNFTAVDTDGNIIKLYEDYLDKGKVVVLKIFFVDCPPCNAIAPAVQEKFVKWGSGNDKVKFIEVSNKLGDRNFAVKAYKEKHGITFPSVSADGGGFDVAKPYMDGTLGQWSGTPFFAVITPDKKMQYEVIFNQLDNFIEEALKVQPAPNKVSIQLTGPLTTLPPNVNFILKNDTVGGLTYNITEITAGKNEFSYPSSQFPKLDKPIIVLESKALAQNGSINVSDLIYVRNHILGTNKFTRDVEFTAADLNESGTINVTDLVIMQKVILRLFDSFPNNVPSYKMLPAKVPVIISGTPGSTINYPVELIKLGNLK